MDSLTSTLKEINIPALLLPYFEPNNNKISKFFEDYKYPNHSIERALEIAVFNQARRDFKDITNPKNPIPPDHIGVCFPYALANNEFSEEEISQIHFDHGDNVQSFIKKHYKEGLISILREKILNPSMESITRPSHMCSVH